MTARITNVGARAGAEVAQLHVAAPQEGLHRPLAELKGFQRVHLAPGENAEVAFDLEERSFALWDGGWKVPDGIYEIRVGASSRDIRLRGTLEVPGAPVPAPAWQADSWYQAPVGTPGRAGWGATDGQPRLPCPRGSKRPVHHG